jgi:threonine aldolase
MKSQEFIDLRSDTVTLPTPEMLEAIRHAELGDDVFREDPTVNRLEDAAAAKMGKEAALLLPSGTQANLVSLMSNCKRGDLVFVESEAHIYYYEVGGLSAIAGVQPWTIKTQAGVISPADLEASIRPKNIHFAEPTLVCIENTHNRHGGAIVTPKQIQALKDTVDAHGLRLYMDGARVFNAAVALGCDVKGLARHVDNLMFCLSKGLSCPVGSVLVGTHQFIEAARKNRKMVGGGMRQAGVIAAPGLIALEKMVDRLREDHENARFLAQRLAKIDAVKIDLERVQTNMATFKIDSPTVTDTVFLEQLKKKGVLALAQGKNTVRFVTHYGIARKDVEKAAAVVEEILGKAA